METITKLRERIANISGSKNKEYTTPNEPLEAEIENSISRTNEQLSELKKYHESLIQLIKKYLS
jgi:hypothetical protein